MRRDFQDAAGREPREHCRGEMRTDLVHWQPRAIRMLPDVPPGDGVQCCRPMGIRCLDYRAKCQRHRPIAVHDPVNQSDGLLE